MRLNRKWMLLTVLILSFALLTGCSTTGKIDPESGLWDRYLVYPLSQLLDYFYDLFGTYGVSILIVTFLVRLLILPLSIKQQRSMQEMQVIQPKIQKLRTKYKKDQQKQQQEMMKLYKEHNVNPMSGCLPMVVQIPIFIAFYQAIQFDPQIAKSTFLYLQLGKPDPYLIFPLLAAFTTYIQMIAQGSANTSQTRILIWIMPIMIFIIGYNLPSALALYWVYGNIFTILQYMIFSRKKVGKAAA
ncbi:membrane protein insertase YidC [Thermoactinomyces sp. DSM 45892]|uniref:membrane protein insertase YidC n=1 Tax=Thermoactinomyces sp. DSM 45892 TaxID=1882753 RepID=UPI00089AA550|nr:membrane protein insertase YidC [Thermoactinomyces sp. DSM 45892]SDY36501.1 protein translocase subunit yidC [Thermoactinomyces sp. DSM 45892]